VAIKGRGLAVLPACMHLKGGETPRSTYLAAWRTARKMRARELKGTQVEQFRDARRMDKCRISGSHVASRYKAKTLGAALLKLQECDSSCSVSLVWSLVGEFSYERTLTKPMALD